MFNKCLIAVSKTTHTTHHAEHIVIGGIDTDLRGTVTRDSLVGENKLEGGIINTREIAGSRRLVFLGAERERVYIDASIWRTGVVLEWLYHIEVTSLALRVSVLSIKLELGSNNWILTPAMEVECCLR